MVQSAPPPQKRSRRFRLRILAVVIVAVAVVAVVVAVVASSSGPDGYAVFQRHCLAEPGRSVVVLSTKTHGQAMGGPETTYELGCRQADGHITSTYESNRP